MELVGTKSAPAVVISQNDRAVVLYRGGKTTRNAVETTLARRNVRTVEAFLDLRINPSDRHARKAEQTLRAASCAKDSARVLRTDIARLEFVRTRTGCAVRVTAAGQTFLTLSGTVRFAQPVEVDWLLASMARPNRVVYREMLTKSTNYRWMEGDEDIELQTALRFRP